jgi:predicted permease
MQTTVLYTANLFFVGLLVLCGANIATLVFARTATRENEISVRTALGASRARIAGQLFAEALVLAGISAAAGLACGVYALKWVKGVVAAGMGRPMMFWWNDNLEPATVIYAVLLAVVVSVIIGVVPALKATGPRVQERLKQSSGASASSLKFGGVWTGVIVTQVAVTVVFLALVGMLGWTAYVTHGGQRERTFATSEYVSARVFLDRSAEEISADDAAAQYRAQMRARFAELSRRLAAEPAIQSVAYGTRIPGMNFLNQRVEIDGRAAADVAAVRTAEVGVNYLDTFHATLLSGRMFAESDMAPGRTAGIVDRTFVDKVLNGRDAVGRQVRYVRDGNGAPGPWIEIVGVVTDLTDPTDKTATDGMLVTAATAEAIRPLYVALHARSNIAAVTSRLRIVAGDVDPALRIDEVETLDKMNESDRVALDFFARLLAGVSIVASVLATAGVYALMAFTVSRRTAEIGIRVALGADPRQIVMATFARNFAKVLLGLAAGAVPAGFIAVAVGPEMSPIAGYQLAVAVCLCAMTLVAIMTGMACIAPARHALRIQPTEALKAE